MYPEQPKMVITQVINIPKGTRGRLHRALDEHRIHKWSRRKLQGEHDASITWIFHTPQTLITLTSANAHQSHLKRTSNAPQAHLKRTSNASQRRFDYLDFATLCPPKAEFFFFFENRLFFPLHKAAFAPHSPCKFDFSEIDRSPHCMKAPPPAPT